MSKKTVKIVVTVLNNAPIIGSTSQSIVNAMAAIKETHDVTQFAVAAPTEGESFLSCLHGLSDTNIPMVVPEWNESNLKKIADIVESLAAMGQ